ncbi:DUF1801 domain-containing protein [Corynebacterium hylobatis]|uniref:DUF1801 domain-containing protein n=2 Tax=Corynebacterium TaxID=1716 RepID=A0A3R9ZFX6_9CORY|nr:MULTISPECIES: DUF1801 domain-containing protein [Corynebacterium]MCS5479943.1 DUF1801 domain-containing protein [Corynebacterium lemuris]RSZ66043.1 DUF1801 domain-containing protein [Corynebacterium hylobatis]
MTTPTDHDAYIAAAPARTLPEADKVIASYAAFSRQCGLYLLPGATVDHSEEIAAADLKATKTGITFTPRKPLPDELVERLVRASRSEAGV